MTLTRQQYEGQIVRLEGEARDNPVWYELRVAVLVAVGFIAIPVAILCSLILVVLSLVTLIARTGFVVGITLRIAIDRMVAAWHALRLSVELPCGVAVTRDEVPQLFTLVDEVCTTLHAPKPHHILLDPDFTASITQVPRLGPLGWQRNYLVIGLPMLYAFSTQQFKAVLAHEMAHLSGQHGRFATWIWRVHQSWHRFMEMLQDNKQARFGLNWFFNRYIPSLSPHAFVIGRLHEIKADRMAAALVGNRTYAEVFLASIIYEAALRQYFSQTIWEQTRTSAAPPTDVFTTMLSAMREVPSVEFIDDAVHQELEKTSDFLDPHPSLSERLAVLGFPSRQLGERWTYAGELSVPLPPATSAAEELLGAQLPEVAREMDETWWLGNLTYWQSCHRSFLEASKTLNHDHDTTVDAEATDDALMQHALAVLQVSGEDEAIPQLEQVLVQNPNHIACHYLLGQVLLKRKDHGGIEHLRYVMEHDVDHALDACSTLYEYFVRQGDAAMADSYADWGRDFEQLLQAAQEERQTITRSDIFSPHDWSEDEVNQLCAQLANLPGVKCAYLVRKQVTLLPERPCYVLGIVPNRWFRSIDLSSDAKLQQAVAEMSSPRSAMILVLIAKYMRLEASWLEIPGAVIYTKRKKV